MRVEVRVDLALVPDVVARRDHVDAGGEERLGRRGASGPSRRRRSRRWPSRSRCRAPSRRPGRSCSTATRPGLPIMSPIIRTRQAPAGPRRVAVGRVAGSCPPDRLVVRSLDGTIPEPATTAAGGEARITDTAGGGRWRPRSSGGTDRDGVPLAATLPLPPGVSRGGPDDHGVRGRIDLRAPGAIADSCPARSHRRTPCRRPGRISRKRDRRDHRVRLRVDPRRRFRSPWFRTQTLPAPIAEPGVTARRDPGRPSFRSVGSRRNTASSSDASHSRRGPPEAPPGLRGASHVAATLFVFGSTRIIARRVAHGDPHCALAGRDRATPRLGSSRQAIVASTRPVIGSIRSRCDAHAPAHTESNATSIAMQMSPAARPVCCLPVGRSNVPDPRQSRPAAQREPTAIESQSGWPISVIAVTPVILERLDCRQRDRRARAHRGGRRSAGRGAGRRARGGASTAGRDGRRRTGRSRCAGRRRLPEQAATRTATPASRRDVATSRTRPRASRG